MVRPSPPVHRFGAVGCVAAIAIACAACQRAPGSGHIAEAGPVPRPQGPLDLDAAGEYVLALVNHDRAEAGLPAVEWDATAAKAAQRHVEDMTHHGFTAHWGTDGSVPEQRYTEAGGEHLVWENAACLFDGQVRELDPAPTFMPIDLEKIEKAFMSEVPPNDGHRQNILKKWHTKVGVGLAKPLGVPQPCLDQEFIDEYGSYRKLPRAAHPGQVVTVSGEVHEPVKFGAVGVARIDAAAPLSVEHLLTTAGYTMPSPFVLYTPPGYQTPKPVQVDGNRFTIDVPLAGPGAPKAAPGARGRYLVSVWASYPEDPALVMVSLRVVDVR